MFCFCIYVYKKKMYHSWGSQLPPCKVLTECHILQSPLQRGTYGPVISGEDKVGVYNLWGLTGPSNMAADQTHTQAMNIEGLTFCGGITVIKFYSSYSQYSVSLLLHLCTIISHNLQFLTKFCQCYNLILALAN